MASYTMSSSHVSHAHISSTLALHCTLQGQYFVGTSVGVHRFWRDFHFCQMWVSNSDVAADSSLL